MGAVEEGYYLRGYLKFVEQWGASPGLNEIKWAALEPELSLLHPFAVVSPSDETAASWKPSSFSSFFFFLNFCNS